MNQKPTIDIKLDGKIVKVPVARTLRTNFLNQFVREQPSQLQRNRYKTLMALMAASYRAGDSN